MHEIELEELAKELKPTSSWKHEAKSDLIGLKAEQDYLKKQSELEKHGNEKRTREVFYNSPWKWDRRIESNKELFDEFIKNILTYKKLDKSHAITTIRVYLSTNDTSTLTEILCSIDELLREFGVDIEAIGPPIEGSWYQVAIGIFKASKKPFLKIKEILEHALLIETKKTKSYTEDTVSLIKALNKTENAAIQIGPLLVIKVSSKNNSQIVVKDLTKDEQKIIAENAFLLQHPERLIKVLEDDSQSDTRRLG